MKFFFTEKPIPCSESGCPVRFYTTKKMKEHWKKKHRDFNQTEPNATASRLTPMEAHVKEYSTASPSLPHEPEEVRSSPLLAAPPRPLPGLPEAPVEVYNTASPPPLAAPPHPPAQASFQTPLHYPYLPETLLKQRTLTSSWLATN